MDQISQQTRQRLAVAALIGQMEAIIEAGVLKEPAELSSRIVLAHVLAAFEMPSKHEREIA